MSQDDFTHPNQSRTSLRNKLQGADRALASMSKGSAQPGTRYQGQLWLDDSAVPWTVRQWDGADWITWGTVNPTTNQFIAANALTSIGFTSQGDLLKGGVAGAPGRFGVGAPWSALHVNGAGNDLEWRRNGWEKLADDAIFAGAGNVDFTGIPSNVKALKLVGSLLSSVNEQYAYVRFSRSGAFDTGDNYSSTLHYGYLSGSPTAGINSWNQVNAAVLGENMSHAGDFGGIFFTLEFPDLQSGRYPVGVFRSGAYVTGPGSGFYLAVNGMMVAKVAGPLDGVRFFSSAGTISGRISCLGLRG